MRRVVKQAARSRHHMSPRVQADDWASGRFREISNEDHPIPHPTSRMFRASGEASRAQTEVPARRARPLSHSRQAAFGLNRRWSEARSSDTHIQTPKVDGFRNLPVNGSITGHWALYPLPGDELSFPPYAMRPERRLVGLLSALPRLVPADSSRPNVAPIETRALESVRYSEDASGSSSPSAPDGWALLSRKERRGGSRRDRRGRPRECPSRCTVGRNAALWSRQDGLDHDSRGGASPQRQTCSSRRQSATAPHG